MRYGIVFSCEEQCSASLDRGLVKGGSGPWGPKNVEHLQSLRHFCYFHKPTAHSYSTDQMGFGKNAIVEIIKCAEKVKHHEKFKTIHLKMYNFSTATVNNYFHV